MAHWIQKIFSNVKVQRQLFILFVLAFSLPVLLIGTFLIINTKKTITNHYIEQTEAENLRVKSILFDVTTNIYNISEDFVLNSELQSILSYQFKDSNECTRSISNYEQFDTILARDTSISTIKLYTPNRIHLVEALKALETNLYYAKDDINAVKHYLIGIFLQIKQNISYSYSTANIPFPTNSSIIEIIEGKYYLYEVMQFMIEQFDMCLNAIGNPTSENILDDVLYYINHNYQDNLKLETIAVLFGYNSSYLGKIFTKKVGESFNSFLDKTRIEHSKELLSEEKLKIYEISDKVGYKNVDYFHKKFKKYIGISPAEYRKTIIDNRA